LSANSNSPGEGPRRRIVIPIGREGRSSGSPGSQERTRRSPGRKRSRFGKVLAILGITLVVVVLLAAGGIFLWWQHYKTTPAYSLAVLIDAAQRNDMTTVQSIIDIDQVVKNFAGEVTDKAASRYGMALGIGAREQIQALTPKLLPRIKENVSAALTARIKEVSENADKKPFIVVALAMPYVMNISVSGDTAKASAQLENQLIELDLARADKAWKIVAFRDETLVQQAIDQVIKDLPAVGMGNDNKGSDSRKRIKNLPLIRDPIRIP
jgi:flagellar basal body-associated protein FliL